jgi:hypothetical protein
MECATERRPLSAAELDAVTGAGGLGGSNIAGLSTETQERIALARTLSEAYRRSHSPDLGQPLDLDSMVRLYP